MAATDGYKIGLITGIEKLTEKLKVLEIDVGADDKLTVVTNAPNVGDGKRVVVAMVGSTVGEIEIKKMSVGGRMSEGMLCDNPTLGWTGGGAGVAAIIPEADEYPIGGAPPSDRPRGKAAEEAPGAGAAGSAGPVRGPGEESLFAKKETKEEKKARMAAKKAAMKAKKAAAAAAAEADAE